ncbi:MAG: FtsX-like permease family protein [Candidatus Latescibacterota bacterium]
MSHEVFIARRYLRSSRKAGFISFITYIAIGGVVLGVAALVIILSVTNGFSGEVKNRLIGMNAHVSVRRLDGGPLGEYGPLLERIQALPEVAGASPVIDSKVIIAPRADTKKVDGVVLWGIRPESFAQVSDLPRHLQYDPDGRIVLGEVPGQKYPGIILGEQLARRLSAYPGSVVFLVTMASTDLEDVVMEGFTPRLWPFVVTDVFETGMFQYDDSIVFVGLEDAQRILQMGQAVSHLHVRLRDIYQAQSVAEQLREELRYPYMVRDWRDLFPEFFEWIELEKWAIFIALSLIILVAAFNIMSILTMSVLVKTPEIGILRAMGCTGRAVRHIFMYQGLFIGIVGTALGCVTGLALCWAQQHFHIITIPGEVYLINSLPVDMEVVDFLLVSAVSLLVCLLTSVYPARKAASLMPVEAIRYIM